MSDFLPKDYKEPTDAGNYLKLGDGDNVIRILSKPVMGYEVWLDEDGNPRPKGSIGGGTGKYTPKRFKVDESIPAEYAGDTKFFWAMAVYNVNADRIQIWQVNQATIRRAITALSNNAKWGDPYNYNIVVTRDGEGKETEYTVTPEPKEDIDKKVIAKYEGMKINLEALLDGENPFETEAKPKKESKDDEVDVDSVPF